MSKIIYGPFAQIVTMNGLPKAGPISDDQLEIIEDAYVLIKDKNVEKVISRKELDALAKGKDSKISLYQIDEPMVLMPGLIDSHTHICYAGSREKDYASRLAGMSYLEIAKNGGGIMDTVKKTRSAISKELEQLLIQRCVSHFERGVTTCEVKSGYGLTVEDEIKMLKVIKDVPTMMDLVPTCLAAHIKPPEFESEAEYLNHILDNLLPQVKLDDLSSRIDIFVEDTAFTKDIAKVYLSKAKQLGFSITVHADQFSTDGAELAAEVGAISADHLEASTEKELKLLKDADVIATVLPGASLGLGMNYAPARKALDKGLCLVIASDWNPGSAPMGDLLVQASLIGAAEKLTVAETISAITNRAAMALELKDRGIIAKDYLADMIAFPCKDYREVFYKQGTIKPSIVWKNGELCFTNG